MRTFETFSFFFKSVVVLELNHPLKIDILEQIVCNAMDARNTCATLRELGPIQPLNKSTKKEKYLLNEEDLIVFEAKKRGLLFSKEQNKKSKRELNRFEHALFLKFKLLNMTARDLDRKFLIL